MNGFYEKLLACKTREEVRAAFFAAEGLVFPAKQKFDCTERTLYVFHREKKFSGPKGADGIAASLAQALYFLRELKYGESACPIPPYVCAVCRGEGFVAEVKPFARFYERRSGAEYDWDRTPLAPSPELVSDLAASPAISRIKVFSLSEPAGAEAFRAVLSRINAVQLSMFEREKKTIDENNFLKVYEYWASLFAESFVESGETRKLAEYFLSDIERGKSMNKGGKVEFTFGGEKVKKSLPAYEYNYFWSVYERVTDERTIFAIRRKIDRLSEDFARRFEGEFYTPIPFAAKAYEYIRKAIGRDKLESGRYRIWDMAAGSGNLEFTLPSGGAAVYVHIDAFGGRRELLPQDFPVGGSVSVRLSQRRYRRAVRGGSGRSRSLEDARKIAAGFEKPPPEMADFHQSALCDE